MLSQERFLLGKAAPGGAQYSWTIPVSYTKANGIFENTKASDWVIKANNASAVTKIELKDIDDHDALVVNVRETGYYRYICDTATDLSTASILICELKSERLAGPSLLCLSIFKKVSNSLCIT